jgi:hypothetical protein
MQAGCADPSDAEGGRSERHASVRGYFGVNRPGEFILRMTITDRVANKTIEFEAPFSGATS